MPRKKSLASIARKRDRNTCQCCYTSPVRAALEVHHINPLVMGGADDINNMVVLCGLCHASAPNDPEKFYEYQRSRGVGGKLKFADFCEWESEDRTLGELRKEFDEMLIENCVYMYEQQDKFNLWK